MQSLEVYTTILLYHGITATPSFGIENFSKKHLPVKEFEAQMEYLARNANVITLCEMVKILQGNYTIPQHTVSVTFDDSFRNIYKVALPVLRRYKIPATFFVSTGFVGTNKRFWVDLVEHYINKTSTDQLEVLFGGDVKQFEVKTNENKITAIVAIKSVLKKMKPVERDSFISALKCATKVTDNGDDVLNYLNLTWEDVCELDDPPFYVVGGHSDNHEILSNINVDNLKREICECKNKLQERLGHTIDQFAYPEGQSEHFNEKVISELKKEGITICPSAIHGVNYRGTDPFHLKRIMVGLMGEKFPFWE
jgi:peptidoglycan/xylan/chitin deacetylase (PgdA/CDA1 family)|tara:strand:+ start:862 stop:1788 length:927 start_codon:yes stop_codon:yes gene_type:complete